MKLSYENVVDSKLAVIPLYPLAPWNDAGAKRKSKGESSEAGDSTFTEIKLDISLVCAMVLVVVKSRKSANNNQSYTSQMNVDCFCDYTIDP